MSVSVVLSAAVTVIIGFCGSQALGTPMYTVTDLGLALWSQGPGALSCATSINGSGQVAGYGGNGVTIAFLFSGGNRGVFLSGATSAAYGVNNAGDVVGFKQYGAGGPEHAFLYSGGQIQDLGTLPGGAGSGASGINNVGQVVGSSGASGGNYHPFLYSGGQMQDLGTLGGASGGALAINDSGQIVGDADTTSGLDHAFLYSGGQMLDLGTFGGNTSRASDINNAGQVVGYADNASGIEHAFLYSGGQMQDLGTLDGYPQSQSYATGINSAGQVVGSASYPEAFYDAYRGRAFLYSGGVMTDLNTLIDPSSGWTLTAAYAINDSGQIVGIGFNTNDAAGFSGFLLTPTPEPATLSLILLGGLALLRRKK
jgi:probable HAF family extracellular repeat protein